MDGLLSINPCSVEKYRLPPASTGRNAPDPAHWPVAFTKVADDAADAAPLQHGRSPPDQSSNARHGRASSTSSDASTPTNSPKPFQIAEKKLLTAGPITSRLRSPQSSTPASCSSLTRVLDALKFCACPSASGTTPRCKHDERDALISSMSANRPSSCRLGAGRRRFSGCALMPLRLKRPLNLAQDLAALKSLRL